MAEFHRPLHDATALGEIHVLGHCGFSGRAGRIGRPVAFT
jgi:hypothetical protein